MFYHVSILTKSQEIKKGHPTIKVDITKRSDILDDIIVPYINNEEFIFEGVPVTKASIAKLIVIESNISAEEWADQRQAKVPPNVLLIYSPHNITECNDFPIITNALIKEVKGRISVSSSVPTTVASPQAQTDNKKVFIVHGHDMGMKYEVARFIESLGLEAVIIDEQASRGQTIIEKIEDNADVGFAVVLYSPCDIGGKDKDNLEPRARQNVVFEHGFMIGHLGRDKVCAIMNGEIEQPTDINGIVYISMASNWKIQLGCELKSAGLAADLNLLAVHK